MGADLILAWADLPPAGLDLGPAIDAVPEDRLAAVWESLHGELPDETEDLDWRAETRAQLHEARHLLG